MRIRDAQIDAFSDHSSREYVDRLVRFLRQEYPEAATAPEAELTAAVEVQVAKAQDYGLESEQDVATYVNSAFLLGEEFDTEFPAAQQVLPSPVLSSQQKAAWLTDWTLEIFQRLEQEPE